MTALAGHLPYLVAVWLFIVGLYGVATSKHFVHMVGCVAVVQSSTYVLLVAIGYKRGGMAPIFTTGAPGGDVVDPVVQALMLTDVVVEATVVALLLALVVQAHKRSGTLDPDELDPMKG